MQDNDPFKEFGGQAIESSSDNDPFAEFGGSAIEPSPEKKNPVGSPSQGGLQGSQDGITVPSGEIEVPDRPLTGQLASLPPIGSLIDIDPSRPTPVSDPRKLSQEIEKAALSQAGLKPDDFRKKANDAVRQKELGEVEMEMYVVDGKAIPAERFKDLIFDQKFIDETQKGLHNVQINPSKNEYVSQFLDKNLVDAANRNLQSGTRTGDKWESFMSGAARAASGVAGMETMYYDVVEEVLGIPLRRDLFGVAELQETSEELAKKSEEYQKKTFQYRENFLNSVLEGKWSDAAQQAGDATAASVPYSAGAAALTYAGGPALAFSVLAPMSSSAEYASMKVSEDQAFMQLSRAEKLLRSNVVGPLEAATDIVAGRAISRSFDLTKSLYKGLVKEVAEKQGLEAADKAAKELSKNVIKKYGENIGLQMAEEFFAEGGSTAGTMLYDDLMGIRSYDAKDYISEILNSGLLGSASGGITTGVLGGPAAIYATGLTATNKLKSVFDKKLYEDPSAVENLSKRVDSMKVPNEVKDDLKENLAKREKAVKAVPEDKVSDTETVDTVQEIQELEERKKGLLPVYQEPIQAEIDAKTEKLKEGIGKDKPRLDKEWGTNEGNEALSDAARKDFLYVIPMEEVDGKMQLKEKTSPKIVAEQSDRMRVSATMDSIIERGIKNGLSAEDIIGELADRGFRVGGAQSNMRPKEYVQARIDGKEVPTLREIFGYDRLTDTGVVYETDTERRETPVEEIAAEENPLPSLTKTDSKGREFTYYSKTKEEGGITTTSFSFNRSDKAPDQRNKTGIPVKDALGDRYEIDRGDISEDFVADSVTEIRESADGSQADASVIFKNSQGGSIQADVPLVQSNKQTPTETVEQAEEVAPAEGAKLIEPKTISQLAEENKRTTPKVRTEKVFLNEPSSLGREETIGVDAVIKEGNESSLPIESISVEQIIPTQKNLTIQNLEETKDVVDSSDEILLVEKDGMFYVIDGHHRIANRILEGNTSVKARVFREQPSQPTPPTDAVQEQSTESVPVRQQPEARQGVREEDTQGQETPQEGEAVREEVVSEQTPAPKRKLNLGARLSNIAQKVQEEGVEGSLLKKTAMWNRMGKRMRRSPFGANLMSEMQQEREKYGYELRPGKTGRMTVVNPQGKEVRWKSDFMTKEEKARRAAERKDAKKYKASILKAEPISVEHYIAQALASGTRFNRAQLENLLGKDYDIPSWMRSEKGMSIQPDYIASLMRDAGYGMDQESEVDPKDIEEAIVFFAERNGRKKAFEYAEEIYNSPEDARQSMTEEEVREMQEYMEQNKEFFPDSTMAYNAISAIDQLTEEQAQALEDEILAQENYESSTKFIQDAERYAAETEAGVGQTETKNDVPRDDRKGEAERKAIAKRLRDKKIGGVSFVDPLFGAIGISKALYDGAIELAAKQVEKGTKIGTAIANAIKYIDERMAGKKWDKGLFGRHLNDQFKMMVNGKEVEVKRDLSEETLEVVNGWYSPLEKTIKDTKADSLTAKEWLDRVRSKEGEDMWTGLRGMLEAKNPKDRVSKRELLNYLKDNRVDVVEVVKDSEPGTPNKVTEEGEFDYSDQTKFSSYQLEGEKTNYKEVLVTLPKTVRNWEKEYEIAKDKIESLVSLLSDVRAIEDYLKRKSYYNLSGLSSAETNTKKVAEAAIKKIEYQGDGAAVTEFEEAIKNRNNKDERPDFRSSHFDEPNILVHLRMNTRKDADGNKVLFLEEVQSDWGQKGKREGFAGDKARELFNQFKYELIDVAGKKLHTYSSADGEMIISSSEKLESAKETAEGVARRNAELLYTGEVPSAPFVTDTNSWVKLGVKVALKEAVAQGVDRIAWTTGEQQNERYDLSKQVNEIKVEAVEEVDGVYFVDIELSSGKTENIEVENGVIREGSYKGQSLEDVIGKEYAEKVLSTPRGETKRLRGADLRLGGKGMKGFYGSPKEGSKGILGSVMEAVTGQEVGKVAIPEGKGILGKPTVEELTKAKELAAKAKDADAVKFLQEQIDRIKNGQEENYGLYNSNVSASKFFDEVRQPSVYTQPSISITPELRSAVEKGQPLFGTSNVELAKAIRDKKITGTLFVDPLFGGVALTKAVYNGALELAAKLVEQNTEAGKVIAAVMKYVDDAMKGTKFNRNAVEEGFKKRLWFVADNDLFNDLKEVAREYGQSLNSKAPSATGLFNYIKEQDDTFTASNRHVSDDVFKAVFGTAKPEKPAAPVSKPSEKATKEAVKEARGIGEAVKKLSDDVQEAAKEMTSTEGRKETDDKFNEAHDEAFEFAEKELSGIMNALVPEDKKGVYQKEKRNRKESLERGKAMIQSGAINPSAFISAILKSPRPLSSDEIAAMVYYKTMLDNRVRSLSEQSNKARENGDVEGVSVSELALDEVDAQIDEYYQFQEATGYEQGHSLGMRQLLLGSEYEIANQVRKYKKATGKSFVPPDVMAKFKMYDEAIKELSKRIDEFEKKSEEASESLEILSEPDPDKPKTKSDAAKLFANKVRQKKFVKSAKQLASLQSDPTGLFKFAWDGALEFIATTVEQGGTIADAVDGAIDKLKNSEWYKNLSQKGKDAFENTAKTSLSEEAMEYAGISIPTLTDGFLHIPDSFVKDLIKNGFDTIETATIEARRFLLENLGIEATERQVRDAISDYGKRSKLSKDEVSQKMREMKRVGKLLSALEDVQRKKRPLRSGRERDAMTQKEREIKREINALLKDIPQTSEETDAAWKSALDATKTRLRNRIEDIQKQIAEGKKTPKKKSIELDAEAKYLKEEVDRLNEILRSIEGKPEMTFEQRVRITEQAIERSIQEYERRIREKDFEPMSKEPVSTPEIEALRTKREQLRKQYSEEYSKSPAKDTARDSAAMKRLQKQIDELTEKIHGRISIESKKEAAKEYGAHVKAMQNRVKSLREALMETEQGKAIAEKRALENVKKAATRSIQEYERRIREKDFAVKKSKQVALDAEAKALKAEQQKWKNRFDTEREKSRLDERTKIEKLREGLVDVVGIPKSLQASLDFSSILRQGGMLTARHPKMAVSATKEMIKQTFNEAAYEKWMDEFIVSDIYNDAKKAGLYVSMPNAKLLAKEESFVSNLAEMIPIYGRLIKASNRAYSSYLNVMRIAVFADFQNQINKSGLSEKDAELAKKDMATFINNATGRGSLLGYEPNSPELNLFFFSPKFVLSRANIVMNTATGYAAYHPKVRKEALLTVATYLSAVTTLILLSTMTGADAEDDPRSSDFGKIRIGKLRLDPLAGLSQMVVFFSRLFTGKQKTLTTGEIEKIKPGKTIKSFARSKASPSATFIIDMLDWRDEKVNRGIIEKNKTWGVPGVMEFENKVYFKNIVGEEQTLPERAISLMTPIYTQGAVEIYQEEGPLMAAAATGSDIIGIGSQYHSTAGTESAEATLSKSEKEASDKRDSALTSLQEKIARSNPNKFIGKDDALRVVTTQGVTDFMKANPNAKGGLGKSPLADLVERHNMDVLKKRDEKLSKVLISMEGDGKSYKTAQVAAASYYDKISKTGVPKQHTELMKEAISNTYATDFMYFYNSQAIQSK